jgi:hypothetical protein
MHAGKARRLLPLMMILFLLACGGTKRSSDTPSTAGLMPDEVGSAGIERSSEVRVFEGESLFEYIDGGAEIYHTYGFMEVATADYRTDGIEMVADIYRFDSADNAFGLYSSLRPDNPELIELGAEGFGSSTSIDFTRAAYVVRVVAFEQSEETDKAIFELGMAIDSSLPGDNKLPATFSLFPLGDALPSTGRFYAESFLGRRFLTDVFSVKYTVDPDTVTLFITADPAGEKFMRWFEQGAMDGAAEPGSIDLPYDDGRVFATDNPYYGKIVAGIKGEWLAGIIGYDENIEAFLSDWIESLP